MALKGKLVEAKGEPSPADWLSADEVAELCGMTSGRVYQLLRAGEMQGEKLRGVLWQVRRSEAEKFVEQPAGGGRPRGN